VGVGKEAFAEEARKRMLAGKVANPPKEVSEGSSDARDEAGKGVQDIGTVG